jgi:DNA-binding PadR family transcriptional regulator
MSAGWWRPSPGSVYPLLEELVQEGVTRRREDGRYELTSPAREQFGWPFGRGGPYTVDDAMRELGALVAYLEDLRRSDKSRFDQSKVAIEGIARRLESLAA